MKAINLTVGHSKLGVGVLLLSIHPAALVAIGLGIAIAGATTGVMLYRLELEKARQHKSLPEYIP